MNLGMNERSLAYDCESTIIGAFCLKNPELGVDAGDWRKLGRLELMLVLGVDRWLNPEDNTDEALLR